MPHSVHSTRENTPVEDDLVARSYWNANVASHLWTTECPQFLVDTSEKNKMILLERDEDFKEFSWQEVKQLIGKHNPA